MKRQAPIGTHHPSSSHSLTKLPDNVRALLPTQALQLKWSGAVLRITHTCPHAHTHFRCLSSKLIWLYYCLNRGLQELCPSTQPDIEWHLFYGYFHLLYFQYFCNLLLYEAWNTPRCEATSKSPQCEDTSEGQMELQKHIGPIAARNVKNGQCQAQWK